MQWSSAVQRGQADARVHGGVGVGMDQNAAAQSLLIGDTFIGLVQRQQFFYL